MIAVTGASGELGKLVVEGLLQKVPARHIIAAVRTPAKAAHWLDKGMQVREADYNRPETLASAFAGVTRVLLISSNELGKREAQHKAVIDAAKAAKARFVAYTSILHADTSPLKLAAEHLATEEYLRSTGIRCTMLRNGWYLENHLAGLAPALQHGAFIGTSGEGKFAGATRADFAAAAVEVLTGSEHANQVYELAGDAPYSGADLAGAVTMAAGKPVAYNNLPEAEYQKILSTVLPQELAGAIADAEAHAANGALDDSSKTLSRLIGRPTTPIADAIAAALKAL